ncbi:hypothetical protein [Edwardsiella tarda]
MVERQGIPLAVLVSETNRHDSIMFKPLLDALLALAQESDHDIGLTSYMQTKGYDFLRCQDYLKRRGIKARIARRGIDTNDRLGRYRLVVERTHGEVAGFGKLRIHFEQPCIADAGLCCYLLALC